LLFIQEAGGAEYTYIHVDTNCYSGKAKVLLYEGEVRTTDSPPARIPMEGLNPIHGRYAHEQHRQSPRDGTSNHTHGEENEVKGKSIWIVDICGWMNPPPYNLPTYMYIRYKAAFPGGLIES
jgi:hypothetical protein